MLTLYFIFSSSEHGELFFLYFDFSSGEIGKLLTLYFDFSSERGESFAI